MFWFLFTSFFFSFLYSSCLFSFFFFLLLLILLIFSSSSFSMPDFLPLYPPEKALYPSSRFSFLCAVASPWSNPSDCSEIQKASVNRLINALLPGPEGDLWEKARSNPSLKKTWLDLVVSK
jgi:hypothetical protein